MILSLLSTEKKAKDFLNDSAILLLVGFLRKSVRNELQMDDAELAVGQRTQVIRTLEKMITSNELIVPTLLRMGLLALLGKALESPIQSDKTQELRATLMCLWTLSQDSDALKRMARDESLVKGVYIFQLIIKCTI